MGTLIGLLVCIILIVVVIAFHYVAVKIKLLFGYKKYEYTKILSHGMHKEEMWHRSDKEALQWFTNYEFVSEVLPNRRTLRPKERK